MKPTFTLLLLLISSVTVAAPKAELWPYWDHSVETNTEMISHQDWQQFLTAYVRPVGEHHLVDYAKVSEEDKHKLKRYISQLASLDPRQYSQAEQYAYWVNLYNALTVDLILDSYPIESITKLGGWFSFGPWEEEVIHIGGHALTLNDIEHKILRPIWQDPRTHYALNCASLGCPNLQLNAFDSSNTEQLLEQAAHAFINSDKGVQITSAGAEFSSIYDWFISDFGGNQTELIKHLAQYRPQLSGFSGKINYHYDWALNKK